MTREIEVGRGGKGKGERDLLRNVKRDISFKGLGDWENLSNSCDVHSLNITWTTENGVTYKNNKYKGMVAVKHVTNT